MLTWHQSLVFTIDPMFYVIYLFHEQNTDGHYSIKYYIYSSKIDKSLSWGTAVYVKKQATYVMLACFVSFILFPVTVYSNTCHQSCLGMEDYEKQRSIHPNFWVFGNDKPYKVAMEIANCDSQHVTYSIELFLPGIWKTLWVFLYI